MKSRLSKGVLYLFLTLTMIIGFQLYLSNIRENEKDFAHFGLIRQGAIYTLLGSKPISTFLTMPKSYPSDHEMISTNLKPVAIDFSKCTFTEENRFNKDPKKLWNIWIKRHVISNNRFALVHLDGEYEEEIFLVNKMSLTELLNERYNLIAKHLNKSFDVDLVIENINDPKSFFWTEIINPDNGWLQIGLCFGYGLENSYKFERCMRADSFDGVFASNDELVNEEEVNIRFNQEVTLKDLLIPAFRFFQNPDPVLEHYKQERARIQEEYKDADLRQLLIDALEN
jgi:hypothetical protein